MANKSRQRYPDMAIDEFGAVGANCGVAMDTGTFDLWAVSSGGSIVNTHQNPVIFSVNKVYHKPKQYRCDYFSFLADRADEIIERLISSGNTGTAKPTGNGSTAFGKDNSGYDNAQSPGRTLVEYAAQNYNHDLPAIRENPFVKHIGSPFLKCFVFATKHIGKDEPFLSA
jgi:hypothetical protein